MRSAHGAWQFERRTGKIALTRQHLNARHEERAKREQGTAPPIKMCADVNCYKTFWNFFCNAETSGTTAFFHRP